jgi:hypothetical protein
VDDRPPGSTALPTRDLAMRTDFDMGRQHPGARRLTLRRYEAWGTSGSRVTYLRPRSGRGQGQARCLHDGPSCLEHRDDVVVLGGELGGQTVRVHRQVGDGDLRVQTTYRPVNDRQPVDPVIEPSAPRRSRRLARDRGHASPVMSELEDPVRLDEIGRRHRGNRSKTSLTRRR